MPQTNQIILNWTPSPYAVSQNVMRASSSNGTYTLLSTLSAVTSTYTDTTVDPYPHTTYYYRIDTVCSNNNTVPSTVVDEISKDCETLGQGVIYGAKRLTGAFNYGSYVNYTDVLLKWIDNSSYYTNPPYPAVPTTDGVFDTYGTTTTLFCPGCGDDINETNIPTEFGYVNGTSDWSNLSTYHHVASYLPTPPSNLGGSANNNMGTIIRKHNAVGGTPMTRGRFAFGIGGVESTDPFVQWYGGEVGVVNNQLTNIPYSPGNPPSIYWNFDAVPHPSSYNQAPRSFTQLVIDKQQPNTSDTWVTSSLSVGTAGANMTGLANVGVAGNGTWYCSIFDQGNTYSNSKHLRCEHHIYKMVRRTDWDQYVNGTLRGYGYQILSQAYHINSSTNFQVMTSPAKHIWKPYDYNEQPIAVIKIWQA